MIAADLTRAVLCLGFFLIHRPSQVWLVYVLAGSVTALDNMGSHTQRFYRVVLVN